MRQKSNLYKAKENRFEDGLLRVDACMDRHNTPRELQYRTYFEDMPSYSFGVSSLWRERRLQADAAALLSQGFKLRPFESLEGFVHRHKDILEDMRG